jgi:hypothetical protein
MDEDENETFHLVTVSPLSPIGSDRTASSYYRYYLRCDVGVAADAPAANANEARFPCWSI